MPLSVLNPSILGQALDALPGAFSDQDLFAVLLRDFPERYTREVGQQGDAVNGDGLRATLTEVVAALESPPLSLRVKPTVSGSWKRLDDVSTESLPPPPDRAGLRAGFDRRRARRADRPDRGFGRSRRKGKR